MCEINDNPDGMDYVKLFHCPTHGTFHLYVGRATVHMTPRELLLLGAAIDRWWNEHRDQLESLQPFDWFEKNERKSQ